MIRYCRALLGALAAAGVFTLALGAQSASAQALTESSYATNTGNVLSLSFDPSGQLYVGIFSFDQVRRVPANGGAATTFVSSTPEGGRSGLIGPDNALYVPTDAGTVYRYAPGSFTADSPAYATGFGGSLHAITFDASGRLYGVSASTKIVSRTAVGGGAASAVCTLPETSYAMIISAAGNPLAMSGASSVIYQCVGSTVSTFATVPTGEYYSLQKDSTGNVYTARYRASGGAVAGEIYRIAPTGGAPSLIATTAAGRSIGLVFRGRDLYVGNNAAGTVSRFANVAPVNDPAPVPTLSEWAMILFGTVLAGGAALYIQRRRLTV